MSRSAIHFQKGLSLPEFQRHYGTEEQCEAALEKARWPDGFRCPRCQGSEHGLVYGRRLKRYQCRTCGHQATLTAGTIMQATKLVNRHPKLHHFRHRKVSHLRAGLWRRFRGGFALAAPAVPLLAHGFRDWLHWLSFVIDTGGTALAVPPHTSLSGVGGGTPPMPDEEEPVGIFLPSGGQAPGLAVLILRLVALSSKSTRM